MMKRNTILSETFAVSKGDLERITTEALRRGGNYCDLFFESTFFSTLLLRDGEVSSGGHHEDYGCGIRVLSGEKTGYAYSESTEMDQLLQAARAAGAQPTAILGFRNKDAVILEDDFQAVGTVYTATDDGSYGIHGFVSDVLKQHLDEFTSVCACGPKPMLHALADIAEAKGIPCQVSMEERMGCGIGACLVCVCSLKNKDGSTRYGHVCKDGPVFLATEVEI